MGSRNTEERWVSCPICGCKTRIKARTDTILEHFPLFCPKCRQETLVNLREEHITIVTEPDA